MTPQSEEGGGFPSDPGIMHEAWSTLNTLNTDSWTRTTEEIHRVCSVQ